jgi:hypothetical protein
MAFQIKVIKSAPDVGLLSSGHEVQRRLLDQEPILWNNFGRKLRTEVKTTKCKHAIVTFKWP